MAIITVEMGEACISRTERLTAVGLGACVGLCVFDPVTRTGAMAHIVLPETPAPPAASRHQTLPFLPGKCADTAVAYLVELLTEQSAACQNLVAAMAGGAQIFSYSDPNASPTLSRLEIGPRNADAVQGALDAFAIPLLASDTGERCGRTLTFCADTGDIFVQRIGGEERLLVNLHQSPSGVERMLAYG